MRVRVSGSLLSSIWTSRVRSASEREEGTLGAFSMSVILGCIEK